ncbi:MULTISPECIES: hypothetical protein [Protofrankia]|uniref:hypothetical protein n=1 Tax=Protofrankia TaxID=2994361 RepID=UPI000A466A7C|nr:MULTISPECIES: hypothetical protein [Protofrankia]
MPRPAWDPSGRGQLLVFTEFTDTAHWLRNRFEEAGFSTDGHCCVGEVHHRSYHSGMIG